MKKEIVSCSCYLGEEVRASWLDLDSLAQVRLTSEDPAFPIECAFGAAGGSGWRSASAGQQTILLHFYAPQPIREIYLRFEAAEPRTQEFALLSSSDGGVTYREIVRQQFNFSPGAATVEEENYTLTLVGVTDLKLIITPDISGGEVKAGLRAFRIR